MKAEDITRLVSVSRPTLSPDGRVAVAAATHPDLDADAYVGQLWSIDTAAEIGPRRLSRGFRDSAPQFSPDGSLLAFLRSEQGAPAQLHVMTAAGGEPLRVTDRPLGVTEFAWSRDGHALAFISRVPEKGRYGTVDGLDAGAEPARRFTTARYLSNGLGWMRDRRPQVFIVDVPAVTEAPVIQPAASVDGPATTRPGVPEARQLTFDDADHGGIVFTPDGTGIAVVSDGHATADDDLVSILTLVPTTGGEGTLVVGADQHLSINGSAGAVAFGADGRPYFLAQDMGPSGRDFVAKNTALYVVDASGRPARRLTDEETVDLGEIGSCVVPTSDGTLVLDRARGRVRLVRVTDEGTLEELLTDREVTGVAHAGSTIMVSFQDATSFGDVAVLRAGSTTPRLLTDFSAEVRATGIRVPMELEATGRDGYPIHGWVVIPQGEGPHPVLLNIHGGPFAQYSVHLFDESQVYADAGYAVVYCNPRGSAGYGQGHGRAIKERMGSVDLDDMLDFLDAAVAEHPQLDGGRVGILGGSYGGYLTAWTIAHDHRFAGAIVERGFLDPEFFIGTSDIGSFFAQEYNGESREAIEAQSPQAHVGDVRTPTLVMHSENDLRCPLSQAQRYYASLRRAGVSTELVVFPGEDHELSRAGRPRHRVQRFEIILDWWSRTLPVGVAEDD